MPACSAVRVLHDKLQEDRLFLLVFGVQQVQLLLEVDLACDQVLPHFLHLEVQTLDGRLVLKVLAL